MTKLYKAIIAVITFVMLLIVSWVLIFFIQKATDSETRSFQLQLYEERYQFIKNEFDSLNKDNRYSITDIDAMGSYNYHIIIHKEYETDKICFDEMIKFTKELTNAIYRNAEHPFNYSKYSLLFSYPYNEKLYTEVRVHNKEQELQIDFQTKFYDDYKIFDIFDDYTKIKIFLFTSNFSENEIKIINKSTENSDIELNWIQG